MFWKLRVTLICILAVLAVAARAATLNVGPGQTYTTIQSAINAASDFDTVLVAPGTYTENIDLLGKWITVTSSGGAAVTIIDGSAKSEPAVTIELGGTHIGGTTGAPTFSGFTVQNGGTGAATNPTGGIYVNKSGGTISNNILTHNHCAGLWVATSLTPPTVQNNEVDNTTDNFDCPTGGGSGIVVSSAENGCVNCKDVPTILTGNTVQNNVQGGHEVEGGGGITVLGGASAQIQNNTVRGNVSAGIGGGILLAISNAEVVQNLVYGNQSVCGGAGIATERTQYTAGTGTLLLASNTLYNNTLTGAACTAAQAGNASQLLFADEGSVTYPAVVVNNIVSGSSTQPSVACTFVKDAAAGVRDTPVLDHNLFFNSGSGLIVDTASCTDPHVLLTDLTGDPQFVNPAANNFQIPLTSPAVDAGNTSALPLDNYSIYFTVDTTTDFAGNPRLTDATSKGYATIDIGAYEFAGTANTQQTNVSLGATNVNGEVFLLTAAGGSSVSLKAVVASQVGGATGCVGPVTLLEDGAAVASANIVAYTNIVTFNNVFLAPGTHHFAASYSGQSPCSAGVSVPLIYIVSNYAPLLSLGSSPNPALLGQPATFTVYISSGDPAQGGPITLADTSTNTVLATLNPGASGFATFTTTTLALGAHPITASYAGDTTHNPASASLTQYIVNSNVGTTMTLASSENPAAFGDTVTFTATVASASGTPTGSVQFAEGATVYATVPLTAYGSAQWSTSTLSLGQHVLTATYVPTGLYTASAASLTESIARGTTTTLKITAAGAVVTSVPSGTAVTLTATVTSSGAGVTPGEVNFCDATASYCTDIHLLGTAQLTAAGTATLKFVPGPGSHTYYAAFKGTTIYAGSVSANVPLTVLAATGPVKTTVGIQASGGQGDYALLGTVATNGPASPTGNLSFLDTTNSNYVLGTATLGPTGSNGISFLNTTTFPLPRENNIVGAGVIATGDFNGDGIADLLVDDAATDTIYILLGNGDGTFTTSSIAVPATLSVGEIVTGDFNGDGKLDFAVSFHSGIAIYLGNGDGTFTAGQTISLAKYANAGTGGFVAADFNGDGILDLAQAFSVAAPGGTGGDCVAGYENCTIQIYLGNGDGTFNALSTSTPSGSVAEMVAADFNDDGKPDLAAATIGDEYVEVLLGNGDGTFTAAPHVLTNEQSIALAAADLNGDGNTDLVVETQYPQSSANILLGNGDGTFNVLPSDPNLAQQTQAVAIGDFNGDGIPDLVQPNENGGYTSVFLGKGDGTFVPDAFSPSVADFIFTSIAVTDFNGDGQSDIAEVSWNNGTSNTLPDQLDVLLAQSPSTAAGYLYNVSPVGTGLHYVDASYPGDSNNAPGVSPAIALEAEQVTTTLGLAASPSPSPLGQTVTLTATLSPFLAQDHYASGNVTFTSNGKTIGTAPLSNGVATLMTSTLPLGTDNLVAKYPGDTNFTSSISSVVPLTISAALTGLSLSSSANPTTANAPITFTLQLTFNSQPAPAGQSLTLTYNPTGTAQIVVPLLTDANGTATFSLPGGLPIGSYLFTASFAGTASQSAASANLTEQVLAPSPTTTQLTCAPSTIPAAGTALLTALVTATSGTPTGSVSFTDNGTALGSSPLSNANGATGSATWNYTPIIAGTHTLTANYSPGIGFVASSATCTETVTLLPTTSTLSIGLTSSPIGSIFQFTATVAPVTPLANPKPTGTVSFYESFPPPAAVALLGTVPLGANGTATLALNKLSSGTDTFYCIYSGDATFAPSQCPPLIKVINAGTTVLSLTSSANPAGPGAPITYTMQLAFSGQAAPAGQSISLAYSPTGTAPIIVPLLTDANGAATYTLAQGLPVGSYLFAATFAATSSQSAATNTLTQVVSASLTGPPDFTLTGPSTITFLTTTTNATPLTIASVGGFTANIALTCNATIPQYVCSVAPGSVPLPANGSAVVTLTLHFVGLAQADRGRAPLTTGERAMLAAMAPLSLLGLLGVRRRRLRWLLGLLCLTVLTTAISACGTDAYPTIFGTYPVTVTGAGTNAGASAPTTHTLNVTTNIIQ